MHEESLFVAALELPTPADRAAFLDRACGGDAGLRARVERLLAADDHSTGILDAGADTAGPAAHPLRPPPRLNPGWEFAGRFRLVRKLGAGGMGEVWQADQTSPVRRPVAVKVIHPGLDPAALLARFDQERQALAVMDHPHIAKVHDAGTADGLPYLAMELVDGQPLTAYCDARRLAVRQRLELFVPVCSAVQHAHQKGVIHRDLKPSNVLVAEVDGKPAPKVIDFGIAKAAGVKLTDDTVRTGYGAVLGTPEYMAPEQAAGDADVDTRADVYALGVILYELLTGTTPIRRTEAGSLLDLLRAIREVDPPIPSRRLSELRDAGRGTRNPARSDSSILQSAIRNPHSPVLDWVVMRALEKDRSRRYESAAALARDVERYLADEVVEARPPSAGYRLRTFVRRNRLQVVAAAAVFAAVVAGGAAAVWQAVRATEAERQARANEQDARDSERAAIAERDAKEKAREAEAAERRRAGDEAANAVAAYDFLLNDLLLQSAPYTQPGTGPRDPDLRVRTLLDRAAARLPGPTAARPLVEGSVRYALGLSYSRLGLADKAAEHLGRAADLLARARGPGHPDTVRASLALAGVEVVRKRSAAARDRLGAVLATARENPDLPPDVLAEALLGLASEAQVRLRPDQAGPYLDEAARAVAGLEDGHLVALEYDRLRGYNDVLLGRYAAAEARAAAALARCRKTWGDEHPLAILLVGLEGMALNRQGRHREAADRAAVAADLSARVHGPDHPETLTARFNLARAYQDAGQHDESEKTYRAVAADRGRVHGPDHPETTGTLFYLAEVVRARGGFAEAEGLYDRVRTASRERPGSWERPEALGAAGRGACLLRLGRYADAEPVLRDALAIYEKLEPGGWRAALVRSRLGAALLGQRKYAAAEPLLTTGYKTLRDRKPPVPLTTFIPDDRTGAADAADRLVELYVVLGKPDEARKWRAERARYPFVAPPPRLVQAAQSPKL